MKIKFTKLITTSSTVKVSFDVDKDDSWRVYNVEDARENGIPFTDKLSEESESLPYCANLTKIGIKGKGLVSIGDIEVFKHVGKLVDILEEGKIIEVIDPSKCHLNSYNTMQDYTESETFIPKNITLAAGMFNHSSASKLTIEGPVTLVKPINDTGYGIFGYTNFEEIHIPDGSTGSLGTRAFFCSQARHIYIPDDIWLDGDYTFHNCSSVEAIRLPSDLTYLPQGCFLSCASLKDIDLSHIEIIGDYAFWDCKSLTKVSLPSITALGSSTFSRCSALEEVILGDAFKGQIYQENFSGCNSLRSITLPAGITSIDSQAFKGCVSLETVKYGGTKDSWKALPISRYNEDLYNADIICEDGTLQYLDNEWVDPNSVSTDDPVDDSDSENTPYYPSEEDNIEYSTGLAFTLNDDGMSYTVSSGSCSDSTVYIPPTYEGLPVTTVTNMSKSYFTELHIPEGVTTLGRDAVTASYLKDVYIPSTIEYIADWAFGTGYAKNIIFNGTYEEALEFTRKPGVSSTYNSALNNSTITCSDGYLQYGVGGNYFWQAFK